MSILKDEGFRGVSLREAIAHRQVHGSWPEASVVITFDDGFANFYEMAMPELARYGFSATVFVISGHVGGRNDWAAPPPGLGLRELLTWPQIAELSAAGIEIGAHTQTHKDLRRLPAREVEAEVVNSRQEIESRLGRPVESFAFPFGGVSRESLAVVRREFRAACTTVLQRAGDEATHELPRLDMYYLRSPRQFQRLLHGQLDNYLTIRQWGRLVREVWAAN
jgi:peptidoglycan/xylan/chitin deacetylase (PgdA/CDA1 family)